VYKTKCSILGVQNTKFIQRIIFSKGSKEALHVLVSYAFFAKFARLSQKSKFHGCHASFAKSKMQDFSIPGIALVVLNHPHHGY